MSSKSDQPWNINIHYDGLLAHLAQPGDRVLDVGCGDGFLSARLADVGCEVIGLDVDAGVLQRARARWPTRRVRWIRADVMTTDVLEPESFDVVVSNAALHHLPNPHEALTRLASLVRPGGRLGIVGFARNGLIDWPMSLIGSVLIFVAVRARSKWEHTAPIVWPPAVNYGQMRRIATRALPGARFRRLWMGRYLLTWDFPPVR